MVDQPLHERLSHLEGWDGMTPEEKFEAIRNADMLPILEISSYKYEELVDMAAEEEEDLEDYLGLYITDEDDATCKYYLTWEVDNLYSEEMKELLCKHFVELEIDADTDFDDWLRAYVRRARLGNIHGRGASTTEPGKL